MTNHTGILTGYYKFWLTLSNEAQKSGNHLGASDYQLMADESLRMLEKFVARDVQMERATKLIMEAFPGAVEITDWDDAL